MQLNITVDNTKAMARFGQAGIPAQVRDNLRRLIPGLTREIGGRVDTKIAAGLKSRNRLQTKIEMVENPGEIYGRVRVVWTGESSKAFVPTILESGAVPHRISAVNANALAFFWPKVGAQVFFKSVDHPGFPGLHFIRDTFAEMEEEIRARLSGGIRSGLAA